MRTVDYLKCLAQVRNKLPLNIARDADSDVLGTAAIVCPVKAIGYLGEDINVPVGENGMGPVTKTILDEIVKRQLGVVESEWSVTVTDN